jgi:hypothetical protein
LAPDSRLILGTRRWVTGSLGGGSDFIPPHGGHGLQSVFDFLG